VNSNIDTADRPRRFLASQFVVKASHISLNNINRLVFVMHTVFSVRYELTFCYLNELQIPKGVWARAHAQARKLCGEY
jgi:hypothetical protein